MFPAPFDYYRPTTIAEALGLLAQHGDDAKILAGGHSLIPAMKLRLARPAVLIDMGGIKELNYIREQSGRIAVGAMTTHRAIEASALLLAKCPLLPEVASHVGDAQVRNRGTIGGSLVHADPAADWPAAILALDAELEIAGRSGRRVVRASDFFVGLMQTTVNADEVLCEIRVPLTGRSVAYVKTEQKASGFALAGVAVVADSKAGPARIGVTGVNATPYRARASEEALGQRPDAAAIEAAAMHAAADTDALSDIHASAEFRRHLARVNTQRALSTALARA